MNNSFFYYCFIEPFTEGFVGILLGIFLWILSIAITLFVIGLIGYFFNFIGRETHDGYGRIINKEFIPEYETQSISYINKVPIINTYHYDDDYVLTISVDKLIEDDSEKNCYVDNVSVTEEFYNSVRENQTVHIKYSTGRLYKSVNIKDILQ